MMGDRVGIKRSCGHTQFEDIMLNGINRVKAETKRIKFEEPCPTCGEMHKEKEPEREAPTTPRANVRTATGPTTQAKTNRRGGRCHVCGGWVKPQQGKVFYVDPFEAYEKSGWMVEHGDQEACRAKLAEKNRQLTEQAKAYKHD